MSRLIFIFICSIILKKVKLESDSMKKGLVLEGGAMRGLFTAGVLDSFLENDITFDGMVGVSAGAAFGCNLKSKQIGRTLRYNKKYCNDKRYCGLYSLVTTGDIFGVDFCYNKIPNELDKFDSKTFSENPIEFYLVATDIEKGEAVYKKCNTGIDDELMWFRASASMPLVSNIVEIGDLKLLDGGISDSVPLKFFENMGYNKNVVVLTRPKDYVKKKNSLMPVIKAVYRKYPRFIKLVENRYNVYNETLGYIEKQEKEGNIFVIRPETALPIGHIEHDSEKIQIVYDIGKKTAEKNIENVKYFLK